MANNEEERLLDSFFQTARQQQIADNGFSDRVMSMLPASPKLATRSMRSPTSQRAQRLSRIWTTCCMLLAFVLFVALHGWNSLTAALQSFIKTAPSEINFTALLACMAVIPVLLISEVLKRERTMP